MQQVDNLLKPDLVAPGNTVVGLMATNTMGRRSLLPATYAVLAKVPGAAQAKGNTVMKLSGTSVAAPAMTGAVALMLQQGAGLLNVDGAVRLARALRTDSKVGRTGTFIPTATLAGWLASGSGQTLGQGIVLSEGLVMSEAGQPNPASPNDTSLLGEP